MGLDEFWRGRVREARGEVPWEKAVELLAVNRLMDPRSELFAHEKWFPQTAMDVLLECDFAVAEKDRLYRCLDRLVEHKTALDQHLAARWRDPFFATRFCSSICAASNRFSNSTCSEPIELPETPTFR